jgi:hypothetical protein
MMDYKDLFLIISVTVMAKILFFKGLQRSKFGGDNLGPTIGIDNVNRD